LIKSQSNQTDTLDPILLEKVMVSGRIPKYVTKYAKDRELSISDLIMAGFDAYRESDSEHAIERLSYHENRVLHWRKLVLQNDQLSNTELSFCNTVRDEFIKQDRGHPETIRQDESWLIPRVRKGQAEGYKITLKKLYNFCNTDKNDGKEKQDGDDD